MPYRSLIDPLIDVSGYALQSLREVDALDIARWRNEQMQVLRQSRLLTEQDQRRYYGEFVAPSMSASQPDMVLVSFLMQGRCIGYGGLTHIDWGAQRAEVSFLLDTSRTVDKSSYRTDFVAFLRLLKTLAFERLLLRRLFTETYDIRPYHTAALEAAGFINEGRLRKHYLIDGALTDAVFHGLLKEDLRV
jgi:RimJ/RimL family protein N-acetyltransferase